MPDSRAFHGFQEGISLERIREDMREFAEERDWNQFHSPRNLLLALVGEVGELSEIFQWKGEVRPGLPKFSDAERVHVGEEMSDVLLYLVRLADRCQIDLASAALRKMRRNAEKYPADKARGKSDKYTKYAVGNKTGAVDGKGSRATSDDAKGGLSGGKNDGKNDGKKEASLTVEKSVENNQNGTGFLVPLIAAGLIYLVIYMAVSGHF